MSEGSNILRRAQREADKLPGGTDYQRFVLLNDAITTFLKGDYIPTKKGIFCNQAGPMGDACSDSWWIGGNYGWSICRNPNHHDAKDDEIQP